MISVEQATSKLSPFLQEQYNKCERLIDSAIEARRGNEIRVNLHVFQPCEEVLEALQKAYEGGRWSVQLVGITCDGPYFILQRQKR